MGTRLKGYVPCIAPSAQVNEELGRLLVDHDDWSCLNDLEHEGLVILHGADRITLTPQGNIVAQGLLEHRAKDQSWRSWSWEA